MEMFNRGKNLLPNLLIKGVKALFKGVFLMSLLLLSSFALATTSANDTTSDQVEKEMTAEEKALARDKELEAWEQKEWSRRHTTTRRERTLFSLLKTFIKNGGDPNTALVGTDIFVSRDELTALHVASEIGILSNVKDLIDLGADVNVKDKYGNVPLRFAVQNLEMSVVKVLLENGADMNVKNNYGRTPLYYVFGPRAAYKSVSKKRQKLQLRMIKFLVKRGADINGSDHYDFLRRALYSNNYKAASYLIDKGVDVDVKNEHGSTLLSIKSFSGNEDDVKFLLWHGANPNIYAGSDRNPLFSAIVNYGDSSGSWSEGYLKVVKVLVENGADIHAKNDEGESIIGYVVENEMSDVLDIFKSQWNQKRASRE